MVTVYRNEAGEVIRNDDGSVAKDEDCCCPEEVEGCCPCDPENDCTDCATITFTGDGAWTTTWDGYELSLDRTCDEYGIRLSGSVGPVAPDELPVGDGISLLEFVLQCDVDHYTADLSINDDGIPCSGQIIDNAPDADEGGSLTIHSCSPFHATGWFDLVCPLSSACLPLLDDGSGVPGPTYCDSPTIARIYFEITE